MKHEQSWKSVARRIRRLHHHRSPRLHPASNRTPNRRTHRRTNSQRRRRKRRTRRLPRRSLRRHSTHNTSICRKQRNGGINRGNRWTIPRRLNRIIRWTTGPYPQRYRSSDFSHRRTNRRSNRKINNAGARAPISKLLRIFATYSRISTDELHV
jgi:hypothetical protein